MDKRVFLDRLRNTLNGDLSPEQVSENVNYYQDYIESRMATGMSEEEVLSQLGDPRLIAKSIISACGESTSYVNDAYEYGQPDEAERGTYGEPMIVHHVPTWLVGVLAIVAAVVVIALVFSILTALAPVLLTVLVIVFCVKLFRDWLN